MSWLTNFVRPKVHALVSRSAEVPENLWHKCPECGAMIFHRELEANLRVCPQCNFHLRMPALQRMELIFDEGFRRLPIPRPVLDPLKFRDRKRYIERLKDAQAGNIERDAIIVASGKIHGHKAVAAVFDFEFMAGSMGVAVGEGLLVAATEAVARQAALIAIPASGGARMQEGILSLMQMPRSTIAVQMVKEVGLPYLVVLTDPTTGGVTASFAMLGDITLAEPGAQIGFAGQRVIEDTIREKLPEGFQRSEYLHAHGMVDRVVPRPKLKENLGKILELTMTKVTPDLATKLEAAKGLGKVIGKDLAKEKDIGKSSGKKSVAPSASKNPLSSQRKYKS
ncbi:MAG: acetyl-CoA carboxylase, carboxyltransferase subunit beta [Alphaproteobacteria bacterium]|nr:acetyl-CoA carboxylase, carboxyltransferase subunit beta [Alphaproteobacteria bacterium]